MIDTITEWISIPGYEGLYKINTQGIIKTTRRKGSKGGILKCHVDRWGYKRVRLCKNGQTEIVRIHTLVARTFLDNDLNKKCVNHIDGDKLNNHVSNLEWATHQENSLHAHHVLGVPSPTGFLERKLQRTEINIEDL